MTENVEGANLINGADEGCLMYQIQTQHVLEIRGRAEHGGHQNSVLMGNTHPPPGLGWL